MHGPDSILKIAGAAAQPTPQSMLEPRLVQSAHEFEAQMMKELLQPLTSGGTLFSGDDDDSDGAGSTGALGSFASQALGQALSESGGFGIANKIIGELSQHGTAPNSQKITKKLQRNSSLGGAE
jgi:Rod binding domain-containing protein